MILVDDRERRSGILRELDRLVVTYRVCRLEVGDYRINGSVTVERKTTIDFMQSIRDDRLLTQAARLRKNGRRSVLIIEGLHLPDTPGIRGLLCSLSVQWYLPLLRSRNPAETAWLLKRMNEYTRLHERPAVHFDHGIHRARLHCAEKMLLQIEGIGPGRARALLEYFGTLEQICTAGEKELGRVKGVGKRLAAQIAGIVQRHRGTGSTPHPRSRYNSGRRRL